MKNSNSEDVKHYLRHLVGAAHYNGNTSLETCGSLLSRIERAIDERDDMLEALKTIRNEFLKSDLVSDIAMHACDQAILKCEAKP